MRLFLFLMTFVLGTQLSARELTDLREFGSASTSTMYLFTSPTCPHCRDFHKTIFPELLKRFVKTKKAQIVIVDMPNDQNALQAVMLMRCLPSGASTKLMNWLYENQKQWLNSKDPKATLRQYATALGMNFVDFKNCLNNTHLKDAIEEQRDMIGNLYGVRGWPTIVLRQGNTLRIYSGTDKHTILQGLEATIAGFLEEQKRASKAK